MIGLDIQDLFFGIKTVEKEGRVLSKQPGAWP